MITITLDTLPPTTNTSLIPVNGRLIHSPKARAFKASASVSMASQLSDMLQDDSSFLDYLKALEGKPLAAEIRLHSPSWKTKKGTIAKKDAANREKLILDQLFKELSVYVNLDDSQIYQMNMIKIDSDIESTVITIKEIV